MKYTLHIQLLWTKKFHRHEQRSLKLAPTRLVKITAFPFNIITPSRYFFPCGFTMMILYYCQTQNVSNTNNLQPYLKNSRRPLWLLCSHTTPGPPTLTVPRIMTMITPPNMRNVCRASVQTTAFRPPCRHGHIIYVSPWGKGLKIWYIFLTKGYHVFPCPSQARNHLKTATSL